MGNHVSVNECDSGTNYLRYLTVIVIFVFTADLWVISWFRSRDIEKKCGVVHIATEAEATFCSRQFRFQQLSNLHVAVWCSLFDFTSRQRTVPLNFATQFVPVILLIPMPVQTECMRHTPTLAFYWQRNYKLATILWHTAVYKHWLTVCAWELVTR